MNTLRPFFNFYGSKWRFARYYGEPLYDRLVEPFAGSASYALHFPDHQVELYDLDPVIAGLWKYLIAATPKEIRRLPLDVEHVNDHAIPQEAKWLIGFWLNKGGTSPKLQKSTWAKNPVSTYWGERIRERIATQVDAIKHWKAFEQSYEQSYNAAPDRSATWFIDPPYNNPSGQIYKYANINYEALGMWCRERRGQVIVCEQVGATWLPFKPFRDTRAMEGYKGKKESHEAWYFQQDHEAWYAQWDATDERRQLQAWE